jgi:hypothetical protein
MNSTEILKIDSKNWLEHKIILEKICKLSEQDYSKASENIHWENWENRTGSLMYCLVKKKRFDNGKFFILLKNNEPIASSGCYISPWCDKIMILGSRTWTSLTERDEWWQGDYLFPKQYEEAKKFNAKACVFTFNLYNEWLIKFLKRIKNKKAVTLGEKNSEFYKDLLFFDNIYNINNTKQKIAAKLISCSLEEFEQKYLPKEYNDTSMG